MSDGGETESTQNPSTEQPAGAGTGSRAETSASQQPPQNADDADDVATEVDDIMKADPATWQWILVAFAVLAVGTVVSYLVWRAIKPTDFMPSSNYAVYAGLFIMALTIERVLEPFSGLFVPSTKTQKTTAAVTAAKANFATTAAINSSGAQQTATAARALPATATAGINPSEAQQKAVEARKKAAKAQKAFHRSQSIRAVLMWATASVLAMLLCASLGVFLLRSVETPSATGAASTSTPAASSKPVPSGPTPAPDPIRWLDLLVTGLVVGAGTKPLHDLISQIQTSSGNSKASSSASSTS
jgi:hypothetical protein